MGWSNNADPDGIMQRRSSSMGLSTMSSSDIHRRSSLNFFAQALGLDGNDGGMAPHNPLGGGGAAAAAASAYVYESDWADHMSQRREDQHRRASSLGLGIGDGMSQMASAGGLSVNPNQHYE